MSKTNLEVLIENTGQDLKSIGATKHHLEIFKDVTDRLLEYAKEFGITEFTLDMGITFLEERYSMTDKVNAKKFPSRYLAAINELDDYNKCGRVTLRHAWCNHNYDIPENFTGSYNSYIQYRLDEQGIVPRSIVSEKRYLENFLHFLIRIDVDTLEKLEYPHILRFIERLSCRYENTYISNNMRIVRNYLRYCCTKGFINSDLGAMVPTVRYNNHSSLPSVYTSEEVKQIIGAIDMGNPCGKRNYAILLLLARSGLRSSDIADMRFSDIDWEHQIIRRIQKKTGNIVELPLMNDVGEAIVDYLKNARPKTNCDHLFVRQKPPYNEFSSGAVGSIVRRLIQRSGVKFENRKCGSHVLRHSLASRLLECDTPMPVISEILGHTNTQTTMAYLRIDLNALRECALEVEI